MLLATNSLAAFYGDFQALFGVDIEINEGETVAIIGANGAGKSTLMRSICGLLPNRPAAVTYKGEEIGHLPAEEILARGITMVPEGRRLFSSLSVEENLVMGAYRRDVAGQWTLEAIYDLFPVLKERRNVPATSLSGGQQQMVAIGRGLMSNPELLLCDEISLGLAPVVIRDIYTAIPAIKNGGASIIIVEQDISQALSVSDRIYCMTEGRITLEGQPKNISRKEIHTAYFGEA